VSTYKSIAGVSQSLANLLGDRMIEPAAITLAPPDVDVDQITPPRLNIYLYHLSENAFLKNQEIPGDGHPGAYGHPPLSLNLHYIFTAFGGQSERGADADMQAQFILGDAMRVLHDYSVISANLMQLKSPGRTILDLSLLDEFEQIKLTLQPKSLEEISKIWTALPRVNFRRSVTYEVSVVQIKSQQQRTDGLPVRERRVYALTMRSPQIDEIFVQPPPFRGVKIAAAQEGETLRLTGHNLQTPSTAVTIDGVGAMITALQDDQIDVVVPTGSLAIGLHSLQVVQPVMLRVIDGQAPVQRGGFSSNVVGFQLLPRITGPATRVGPNTVSVPVLPAVKSTQERSLLLGDHGVPGVPPQPSDPPATNILFQLPQPPNDPILPGQYLMRVRIDGAESRLELDPNNLTYVRPTFTV
jgi:Pvc16 N-terminal domain/IPT/TIG domain